LCVFRINLNIKLAAGYTGEAEADSDDDADGRGESAPLSPRSKESGPRACGAQYLRKSWPLDPQLQ